MEAVLVILQSVAIFGVVAVGLWLLWRPLVTSYRVSGDAFEITIFGLCAVRLRSGAIEVVEEVPIELLNLRGRPAKHARFLYAAFRPKYVIVVRDRVADRVYYLSEKRKGELQQVFAARDESVTKTSFGR